MKWLKAKNCYICGSLFAINRGGYIIAKKYSTLFLSGEIKREIAICGKCACEMENFVKHKRTVIE